MNDQNRGLGAVLVSSGDINKNFPVLAHRLFVWFQRCIVPTKNFAFGQGHRELERFPFGIALVRKIGIDLVFGTYRKITITFCAGVLSVRLGGSRGIGEEGKEANGCK